MWSPPLLTLLVVAPVTYPPPPLHSDLFNHKPQNSILHHLLYANLLQFSIIEIPQSDTCHFLSCKTEQKYP